MGRSLYCDYQHQAIGRKNQFFPMCLRPGLLSIPNCPGSVDSWNTKDFQHKLLLFEIDNSNSLSDLVRNGLLILYLGSISFMNVIIDD